MVLAGASAAAGPRAGHPTVAKSNFRAAAVGVVKQVGLRNYAGPNCPGKGWNCTSAKRVLQISAAGGENVAQCGGSGPVVVISGQTCSITQTGSASSTNYAKCYERSKSVPAAVQECTITQLGANNTAIVDQLLVQTQGSTQKGTQRATVTQGSEAAGSSALNSSSVSQDVKQNTAGTGASAEDNAEEVNLAASGGPQAQDAYQSAVVTQYASGSGKNDSSVDQSEWQKAHKGSSQSQNAASGAEDCVPFEEVLHPNICANVSQTGVSGTNASRLRQALDQNAKLLVVGLQTQGSEEGGLEGRVHQETAPGMGSSSNDANQSKHQEESQPASTDPSVQVQFDPISCCGFFSQDGGIGNAEKITQTADLRASQGVLAEQHLNLIGESNSETGSCTFDMHGSINTDSESLTATVPPPCEFQRATLECTNFPPVIDIVLTDVIIQQEGEPCEAFGPENSG
jgi:hypothetical protein